MLNRFRAWRDERRQRLVDKTHAARTDPEAQAGVDAMRNPTPTPQQQRTTGGG